MTKAIKVVKNYPLPFASGQGKVPASEHAIFRMGGDGYPSCLLVVDDNVGEPVEWETKFVLTGDAVDGDWQYVGTHWGNDRWSGQHLFMRRVG